MGVLLHKFQLFRKNQRGFTLIELMATLAILALIVMIAVPSVGSVMEKAKTDADVASVALIENAGEMAAVSKHPYDGDVPESYTVPGLIEAGYLKLDEGHALNDPANYVVKTSDSGVFAFNGEGSPNGAGMVAVTKTCEQAEAEGFTCVESADALDAMRSNMSGKYMLVENIDLSGTANWTPIGTADAPFTGVLDGNGMVVTGLTTGMGEGETGLFGTVSHGSISNLSLVDATLADGAVVGAASGDERSSLAFMTASTDPIATASAGTDVAAFLIGDVWSTGVTNPTSESLTLSNISISGTVDNAHTFAPLFVSASTNSSVIIDNIATDVAISGVENGAGLFGSYKALTADGSISVADVDVVSTIDSSGAAAGAINTVTLDGSEQTSTFENITVTTDLTAVDVSDGFANLVTGHKSDSTLLMRNITVRGSVEATGADSKASGFTGTIELHTTKYNELAYIDVAASITAGDEASGFTNSLFNGTMDSYYDPIPVPTGEQQMLVKHITLNNTLSARNVGTFAIMVDVARNPGQFTLQHVTIDGTATFAKAFGTISEMYAQGTAAVTLADFDIDVSAGYGDAVTESLGYFHKAGAFIAYLYADDSVEDLTIRDIDITADITGENYVNGFIFNIDTYLYDVDASAAGRVVIDNISLDGSLTSTRGFVSPLVGTVLTSPSNPDMFVDMKNITIDYAMVANNGIAFTPSTIEDWRSMYRKQETVGYSQRDTSGVAVENISSQYDLSGHTGDVSRVWLVEGFEGY